MAADPEDSTPPSPSEGLARREPKDLEKPPTGPGRDRWGRRWLMPLGIYPVAIALVLGTALGLGSFTFGYGEGTAYLSNNPAACANCHVMQDHYNAWQNSSHRHVATCNDCHLPPGPIEKWVTKADNGFFHSFAFTTGDFPEPIQIKPRNRRVTQAACIACHSDYVNALLPAERGGDMLNCVHCHADVGHALR